MSDIEWVAAPPPALRGQGITQRFVAELQTRPGEWAKYPTEFATSSSIGVYRTKFPDVEWVSRRNDGKVVVYARYIGAAS